MPLIILICGILFAVFALIAPDIAWPLFTAVTVSMLAAVMFIVALWALMCWRDIWSLIRV